MQAGNAYPSGHQVLTHPFLGLACAPNVETRFLELVMSFSTFHLEYPLVLSGFCFQFFYDDTFAVSYIHAI